MPRSVLASIMAAVIVFLSIASVGQMSTIAQNATPTGINIYTFQCGLMTETWSVVDHLGRLRQHGLLPEPEATPEV